MNLAAAVLMAGGLVLGATPEGSSDPRSTEILRYECHNELARRDVTLFANGTIRLREGLWGDQGLALAELGGRELEEVLDVLRTVDLRWVSAPPPSVDGPLSETCRIRLALPGDPVWEVEYAAWAVPPLAAERLRALAEDLATATESPRRRPRLPDGYRPRTGDLLRSHEGVVWRVIRLTSDGAGVELQGRNQPVRIFVSLDSLAEVFEELVER